MLVGATSQAIRQAVESAPNYRLGAPEIIEETEFYRAIEAAHQSAKSGDIVVLSPACAAFDLFKNFMERGDTYKKIVLQLPPKK